MEIGGLDNPVIRHPLTRIPYIPGSSLKGKLRSLLEYREGKVQPNGEPCNCRSSDCLVCRIFGPHKRPKHNLGPSRLIVRDASMTTEWVEKLEAMTDQDLLYTEIKTENMIDRCTGVSAQFRTMERIPAGTQFDLNLSVRIFEDDDEQAIIGFISSALDMLQQDTLGGSGTRGYGWVEIAYQVGES
jgi:CRISPR-associated protein Csm3